MVVLALQGREDQARNELSELHSAGMKFETINLGLLAPAAQRLGALWEDDRASFVDVTIAMGTLQRLMQFTSLDLDMIKPRTGKPPAILVFPEPGAQHSFGARMAAAFFRHAGWEAVIQPDGNLEELSRIVASRYLDVLGISLGRSEQVRAVKHLIRRLRVASKNPNVLVIAGGWALAQDPQLMDAIGADAAVVALVDAAERTEALLASKTTPD